MTGGPRARIVRPVMADPTDSDDFPIPPRRNPNLIGQDEAERVLLAAWGSGRMPHAWLLTGPRGVGKATLAYRFARFVLAGGGAGGLFGPPESLAIEPDDPVFHRVASGGHADLLTVEPGFTEDEMRKPADERRRRRETIGVDEVRAASAFLRLTPAEGGWRVIVVDSADQMTPNAANALLEDAGGAAGARTHSAGEPRARPADADHPVALLPAGAAPAVRRDVAALIGRHLPDLPEVRPAGAGRHGRRLDRPGTVAGEGGRHRARPHPRRAARHLAARRWAGASPLRRAGRAARRRVRAGARRARCWSGGSARPSGARPTAMPRTRSPAGSPPWRPLIAGSRYGTRSPGSSRRRTASISNASKQSSAPFSRSSARRPRPGKQMSGQKTYYVTTPIYYVNDVPHIGHAYTTLACDVLARFKRLDGYDVFFLTGTDEHGQKVEKSAAAAGLDPQAFTDRVSQNFRDLAQGDELFSNDQFIRTTEARHAAASPGAVAEARARTAHIYLGTYAGWYAVRDEAFYAESELTDGPGRQEDRAVGRRVRMGRGAELFLPPVEMAGPAARVLRRATRTSSCRHPAATR